MGQGHSWHFNCGYGLLEYCIPSGWENEGFTPYSKLQASEMLFQGSAMLPVTFFTWENSALSDANYWRGKWDKMNNKLFYPNDPFDTQMFISYGTMTLYDVDQMIQAYADNRDMDQAYYYDAYWFSLNTRGTDVALRDGEIVLQYMAIENNEVQGFYEQFSCVGQFAEKSGTFEGNVYNYQYSNTLLDAQSAISNGDNIDFQTFYHPLYVRDGPWSMAASERFYTTYYAPDKGETGITCTAVRQTGAPNGARLNVGIDDVLHVNLGYRVYADDNDTVPRHAEDYDMFSFVLLGAQQLTITAAAIVAVAVTNF